LVWGPVGGAVRSPLRLWPGLGIPGIMGEILDLVAVRASTLLPATRRTWRRATVRLLNNKESLDALPKKLPGSSKVLNNAAFVRIDAASPRPRERYVVFPSPLDPRKGPRLALQAMLHTKPDVRLLFAADGIERGPLERMAKRLGLADRVEILGWIPRPQMFELLAGAAASIHVGLREEGGAALCEAMLHGTPVVVLAHGGARTLAEVNTDPSRVALIPPRSFAETARAIGRAIDHFADNLSTAQSPTIDQEHYQRSLQEAFEKALGRELEDTPLVEGEPPVVEAAPNA
jgi:glycosyltransferase involved in cell wall biosynthesis